MSVFEKARFKIFNTGQHPLQHDSGSIAFSNPRLPGSISDLNATLNYIIAALYPNYIGTYATPAALPVSASVNDYAFVTDDGDGKSAGYVWQVLDAAGAWIKRYDVDWSAESIFAEAVNRTQYMYVAKYGFTDHDASGTAITGLYAGQTVYGGNLTNQNLTFNANSVDSTGYVQTANTFRPTVTDSYDLGTSIILFRTLYLTTSVLVGSLTLRTGQIIDDSGAISFGSNNLTTTGNITSAISYATTRFEAGTLGGNKLNLASGSITDDTGAISFGDENLTTTGNITCVIGYVTTRIEVGSLVGNALVLAAGSITDESGAISFDNENLSTTGSITTGQLNSDNLRLDANTISSTNTNGPITIVCNGSGAVDIQSAMTTIGQTVTGVLSVTGQLKGDNLMLDGNTLSSTDTNGNIVLSPNGSGFISTTALVKPSTDAARDLGSTVLRWQSLYLSGNISDGSNSIAIATLLAFRSAISGISSGMTLFWDSGTSTFLPSLPDTEITHSTLTGLTTGDAGHTQFALLAGRSGGQTLYGDTASSGNLTLGSTAHATKGTIFVDSKVSPVTNASYSGSWSGTDIGDSSHYFKDLYTKGVLIGGRMENYTSGTLPSGSAQNPGRMVWSTDNNKVYIDIGGSFLNVSVARFISDTSWNGSDTSKVVTVSSTISDARNAIWQLCDNTNDYDRIYCSIKATSQTQVTITVAPALPAGSYRLIGLE